IHFFYFSGKSFTLKILIFHIKQVAFINFALRYNAAPFAKVTVFIQYFFLCPHMLSILIIKHISGCDFYLWVVQWFSFAENQMDMIICLCLIVMKRRTAFHAISDMKYFCKQLDDIICPVSDKIFRQRNNQFPPLNAASFCPTGFKILLIFPLKIFPELLC